MVTYDIKGAFLNAAFTDNDEPTYIIIRKEVVDLWVLIDPSAIQYVSPKGDLIISLEKFVYGLKQAPIKFQEHLRNVLKLLGYVKSIYDDCLYTRILGDKFSFISTHVDDILQVSNSNEMIEHLYHGLLKAYGTVTFNKTADAYLGMSITRSLDGHLIEINQSGAISLLLEKYLTEKDHSVKTPHLDTLFDQQDDEELDENKLNDEQSKKFLSIVMSLMYIARLTRPDILLPVTYLATRSHYATKMDWDKLIRILRYLKQNSNLGITVKCEELQLYCHCDASYGIHKEGRSHTGFVIYMGYTNSYVFAKSSKQKIGSTSSTDAEIIALVDSLKVLVWLKNVLTELDIVQVKSATVYQDNKSGIYMITDISKCNRSKHLLTKIDFAKDLQISKVIDIVYLNTNDMSSDLLTKPLSGSLFIKHRNTIMNTSCNIIDNTEISNNNNKKDDSDMISDNKN
jgi:hypothetical protein